MLKIKLVKVASNHNNVRSIESIGFASGLPKVGEVFKLFSDALDPEIRKIDGSFRMIETTPVVEMAITGFKEVTFQTQNSTYKVIVLDDGEDA